MNLMQLQLWIQRCHRHRLQLPSLRPCPPFDYLLITSLPDVWTIAGDGFRPAARCPLGLLTLSKLDRPIRQLLYLVRFPNRYFTLDI